MVRYFLKIIGIAKGQMFCQYLRHIKCLGKKKRLELFGNSEILANGEISIYISLQLWLVKLMVNTKVNAQNSKIPVYQIEQNTKTWVAWVQDGRKQYLIRATTITETCQVSWVWFKSHTLISQSHGKAQKPQGKLLS